MMGVSDSQDFTLKHRAQLALILCVIVYVIAVMDFGDYSRKMNNEIIDTIGLIGKDNGESVINRSHLLYSIVEKYLPDVEVRETFKEERDPHRFDRDGANMDWLNISPYQLYHKSLLLVYQVFFRFSLLLWWGGIMLPLTVAIIYQGYNQRQIKMYEFSNASAVKQNIWIKTSIFMSFMLSVYLLLPYASSFGVIYPPLSMVLTAVITKNVITHVTKTM